MDNLVAEFDKKSQGLLTKGALAEICNEASAPVLSTEPSVIPVTGYDA